MVLNCASFWIYYCQVEGGYKDRTSSLCGLYAVLPIYMLFYLVQLYVCLDDINIIVVSFLYL